METGGAEGALVRLVTNDLINEHLIISLKPKCAYEQVLNKANVKYHLLKFENLQTFRKNILALIDIINENEPDIVQSWMYHSNLIASLALCFTDAKVQSVWNIRHSTLSLKNDKKQLISLVLLGSILSRIFPSKIIFCANSAALAHFKIGYSKKKSSVIGNGYPEYKGQQINLMEIEARPKKLELGYFARYHPQKNHKKLFAAVAILRNQINIQLTLAGRGCDIYNMELAKALKQFNLTDLVNLKGELKEPRDLMKKCDYTMLVSDYGEGFPNIIGESLSVGTPCIVTDIGDAKDILKQCGEIVEINSLDDLVLKIQYAWEKRQKIKNYRNLRSLALKTYCENLSIENMVNEYCNAWSE